MPTTLQHLKNLFTHDWKVPHKQLVVLSLAFAVIWLVPNKQLPWTAFHHEVLAAIWLLMFAAGVAWQTRPKLAGHQLFGGHLGGFLQAQPYVSKLFLSFLLVALPSIHWVTGVQAGSRALLSSAYIGMAVLAVITAFLSEKLKKNFLLNVMTLAFLAGSIVSVGIQLAQFAGVLGKGVWAYFYFYIMEANPGERVSGNLGQPNLLAIFYVCSAASLFHLKKYLRLSSAVMLIAGLWIFLGLALTQSRIGLAGLVIWQILLLFQWRSGAFEDSKAMLFLPLGGAFVYAAILQALPAMHTVLGFDISARGIVNLAQNDLRLAGYRAHLAGLSKLPLVGYGIDYSSEAYIQGVKELTSDPQYFFAHSHNILFDYLAWFGIPLGVVVLTLIYAALPRLNLLSKKDAQWWLALSWILFYAAHSMVELPHYYTTSVLIVFLSIGVMAAKVKNEELLHSKPITPALRSSHAVTGLDSVIAKLLMPVNAYLRWLVFVASITVGTIYSLVLAMDYIKLQDYYVELRYEQNKVGVPPDIALPSSLVLEHVENMMHLEKWRPSAGLSQEQLLWVDMTLRNQLSSVARLKATQLYALNQAPDKALAQMRALNAIIPNNDLTTYRRAWKRFQLEHAQVSPPDWPAPRTAGDLAVQRKQ
jgi:hypothetical protein